MPAAKRDRREVSEFDYPDGQYNMYDPILRLRVACERGPNCEDGLVAHIGIHHDPGIERGRYWMAQPEFSPEEFEIRKKMKWDFDRPVPFRSSYSQAIAKLSCYGEDRGDRIRLKVHLDGYGFRCHEMRGRIEGLNIPRISTDVASMYMCVMKAVPRLLILREPEFSPDRFADARTVEICVTTSALTEGLGRTVAEYTMVEAPKPGVQRPNGPRSISVEAAKMLDEGWHRLASWPMRPDRR